MDKALSLISAGIDSPVATYKMIKQGLHVDCIHFDNRPFTDEKPIIKIRKLLKIVEQQTGQKIKLYIVPHGPTQAAFAKNCQPKYRCIFCRRMMYRIAQAVPGYMYIVTGENLGQVASQTLTNLMTISSVLDKTILRPLLTYDKNEIIAVARKIGTYETSIEPSICCRMVPPNPATMARLPAVEWEEKSVDVTELVDTAIKNIIIDTSP